jgi:CheY-like chemotaxis protein
MQSSSADMIQTHYKNLGLVDMTTKRILVVDDDVSMREIVQVCLENLAGWEVLTASSGQEGLALAITEKPDAIVLDVMMPGMDGITFLQHLKAEPTIQCIPVVLLTAVSYFTEPKRIQKLGVVSAISKPFDLQLLVDSVAEALHWTNRSHENE